MLHEEIQWEISELQLSIQYEQYDYVILMLGHNSSLTSEQHDIIQQIKSGLFENGKDLHVITECDDFACRYIEDVLEQKYDAETIAQLWLEQIELDEKADAIVLVDCDRTISIGADSTYLAFDYWKQEPAEFSQIYAGGFFSSYQAAKAVDLLTKIKLFTDDCITHVAQTILLNDPLINDLKSLRNVQILPITAGNAKIWQKTVYRAGLNVKVPDTGMMMSEAIKYQVCRKLQQKGHFVVAIGDSMVDIPMLVTANRGYVITNKGRREYIERALKNNLHIHCLSYCSYQYSGIQSDDHIETITVLEHRVGKEDAMLINKAKSSEDLYGAALRAVHRKQGELLAERINADYAQSDFYVVIVMRSGLSVGLAIADYFDCPILFCVTEQEAHIISEPQDMALFSNKIPIIVDGVVNTGNTLTKLNKLPFAQNKPCIFVTSVLSSGAKICPSMKLYTARLSANYYANRTSREKRIDTSDRLFRSF